MLAIFFGTYDATAHPRVAVLRDGLREHGVTVLECNAPLGLSTADRVAMLRQPWRLPLLAARLARLWARLALRSRRLPRPDVVVVGYLGHFDVRLARALYPRQRHPGQPAPTIVLDHLIGASDTARDRGVDGGLRQRLLRALDTQALNAADLVLVDTEEHRALLGPTPSVPPVPNAPRDLETVRRPKGPRRLKIAGGRAAGRRAAVLVVPVGAPATWLDAGTTAALTARRTEHQRPYASPPDGRHDELPPPLQVVFFGLFTPLQGAPVIGRALAALTGQPIHATMVGSGQDLDETRRLAAANDRVTWLDWVEPGDLPALVASHDVCLGIFGTGPKAHRVVPNKIFQGAAAGCALVTSDTAPQRRVLGDAAILVPPGDPAALAAALTRLAADRDELDRLRAGALALARDQFTPARVTAGLTERLRPNTQRPVVQENA